ncbi:MAG: hypothetical protein OXD32_01330, partial [Endozoicomonadaceae bacterium]|nr:hypothetical protein [Endozoicomonadaceae bacterium]
MNYFLLILLSVFFSGYAFNATAFNYDDETTHHEDHDGDKYQKRPFFNVHHSFKTKIKHVSSVKITGSKDSSKNHLQACEKALKPLTDNPVIAEVQYTSGGQKHAHISIGKLNFSVNLLPEEDPEVHSFISDNDKEEHTDFKSFNGKKAFDNKAYGNYKLRMVL